MKENFYIIIESFHAPDRGGQENVHQLSSEEVAQREVHHIDIANNAAVSRNVSWLFKIGVQLLKRKGLGGVVWGGGGRAGKEIRATM